VRIRPRLVTRAGFEVRPGIRINPSQPQADAASLNGAAMDGEGPGARDPGRVHAAGIEAILDVG
jgi:hypothetical protein